MVFRENAPVKKEYVSRCRSLRFNLEKNDSLRTNLLSFTLTCKALAAMTPQELADDEKRREREESRKKFEKEFVINPIPPNQVLLQNKDAIREVKKSDSL